MTPKPTFRPNAVRQQILSDLLSNRQYVDRRGKRKPTMANLVSEKNLEILAAKWSKSV